MAPDLPIKRKCIVNPKLFNDDNMSNDAIKCRKLEALKASKSVTQISASQASTSRCASVEAVEDNKNIHRPNARSPKNPNTIIESVDDDDDNIYVTDTRGTVRD